MVLELFFISPTGSFAFSGSPEVLMDILPMGTVFYSIAQSSPRPKCWAYCTGLVS